MQCCAGYVAVNVISDILYSDILVVKCPVL